MVGVILNLAIWFALHVLFATVVETRVLGLTLDVPVFSSANWAAIALTAAAMLAIFRFGVSMGWVLAACALAGIGLRIIG